MKAECHGYERCYISLSQEDGYSEYERFGSRRCSWRRKIKSKPTRVLSLSFSSVLLVSSKAVIHLVSSKRHSSVFRVQDIHVKIKFAIRARFLVQDPPTTRHSPLAGDTPLPYKEIIQGARRPHSISCQGLVLSRDKYKKPFETHIDHWV